MIKSEVTKKKIKNGKVEAHATVEINGSLYDITTELLGILNGIYKECPELLLSVVKEFTEGI